MVREERLLSWSARETREVSPECCLIVDGTQNIKRDLYVRVVRVDTARSRKIVEVRVKSRMVVVLKTLVMAKCRQVPVPWSIYLGRSPRASQASASLRGCYPLSGTSHLSFLPSYFLGFPGDGDVFVTSLPCAILRDRIPVCSSRVERQQSAHQGICAYHEALHY
jgi:hypothetical protein